MPWQRLPNRLLRKLSHSKFDAGTLPDRSPTRKFTTILELRLKATSVCAQKHRHPEDHPLAYLSLGVPH
jgi:hypothetical protein